jgi:pimeloyl-ACP methyl ester carboxylesterase
MSVFVLVHGGFYGGWGFTKVANIMRTSGHEVFTPTLTGYGERSHLLSPQINLHTHIQDILNVLECEDLHDVILAGHSYSTMVITGVAEKVPERLSRLVYIDTVVPKDGKTFFDLVGHELAQQWLDYAKEKGDGWRGPALPNPPASPPRWQPAIINGLNIPLDMKNPIAAKIPRAYINCPVGRSKEGAVGLAWPAIERDAEEAKRNGWFYRDIAGGHSVMLTNPKLLADTLLELA